jgi:hypothetical protein
MSEEARAIVPTPDVEFPFALAAAPPRWEEDRQTGIATHGPPVALAAAVQTAPPVIDVTIGEVEVTIEGNSQPPLRTVRRPEPRHAASSPTPPAVAGRLARQYLDR